MVLIVPVLVRRDMATDQPQLPPVDPGVRLLDRRRPLSEALDFGPRQGDTTLEPLEDLEAVSRPTVAANDVIGLRLLRHKSSFDKGLDKARTVARTTDILMDCTSCLDSCNATAVDRL